MCIRDRALDALPEGLPIVPAAQISTVSRPEVETDDAFLRKLRSGKKVIAVELDSPQDADLTAHLEGARRLQAAGTDLMTVADCQMCIRDRRSTAYWQSCGQPPPSFRYSACRCRGWNHPPA